MRAAFVSFRRRTLTVLREGFDRHGILVASGAWIGLSAVLLLHPPTAALVLPPFAGAGFDFQIWEQVPERMATGRLYDAEPGYGYVFAPGMAWILAAVVSLGYPVWLLLHAAVLPLLSGRWVIVMTLLFTGFWWDTIIGNTVVFMFAAGAVALRGSTPGAIVYFSLFVLMPRAVHAPLAIWLAWKRPTLRLAFAGIAAVGVVTTIASGYAYEWFIELLVFGSVAQETEGNFSPTRLVGAAWLVVGVPLGVHLTMKGKVGMAGLAMSPYFGASYLLGLLWDAPFMPRQAPTAGRDVVAATAGVTALDGECRKGVGSGASAHR